MTSTSTRPLHAFIHVQHLLGTGHAVRAAAIGQALAARGVDVTLATGNILPPTLDVSGLTVIALPPVRSPDAVFNRLVTPEGVDIDEAWMARRAEATMTAFTARPVDILLTETYPFGRRQFEFELAPLLAHARALPQRPLTASSIRDILVRKQQLWKEEWMADQALASYDRVLVHSDPDFVELGDSFPFADRIAHLVRYTGYVSTDGRPEAPGEDGRDEVILSCGGGAVSAALIEAALGARALSARANDARWRLLVGHDVEADAFASYVARTPDGVIVERARRDFPNLLARARLSVSQAGYNTVLDILRAGVPSVLVPFAQVKETEQTQRAEALAGHRRAVMLAEKDLSAATLARAVDEALSLPHAATSVRLGGAEASADILLKDLEEFRT
ncbi:glycosyltransferase family protein [Pannonibacter phragmitetus]|uniref:Glycosyltransferase n=1 Tax=Pannonibacter phragmitetus TaxID=121719 RepID=A0A0U3ETH7_9HYPH|nr:glycosyltransferase [Pannonibacter phragmitetus]ALV29455.1 glycosyltransferase [Pannonibacter phragmitetus]